MARPALLLPLLLAACTPAPSIPGSEVMGTFAFEGATLLPEATDCPRVPELPDGGGGYAVVPLADGGVPVLPEGDAPPEREGFPRELPPFSGTFSREPDAGTAWFTLADAEPRDATFDGQRVQATATAERRFGVCGAGCVVTVEETLTVALLSDSQAQAVGGECPPDALDGGVPPPDDAGIRAPGVTPSGYDATRACGLLEETVRPPPDCPCRACRVVYRIQGSRR